MALQHKSLKGKLFLLICVAVNQINANPMVVAQAYSGPGLPDMFSGGPGYSDIGGLPEECIPYLQNQPDVQVFEEAPLLPLVELPPTVELPVLDPPLTILPEEPVREPTLVCIDTRYFSVMDPSIGQHIYQFYEHPVTELPPLILMQSSAMNVPVSVPISVPVVEVASRKKKQRKDILTDPTENPIEKSLDASSDCDDDDD